MDQHRAGRQVGQALTKLEHSNLSQPLLRKMLASKKAAPYLPQALPQLASLTWAHGIDDVVHRLTRGGQNGAYELAVAHAFRGQIKSVSSFVNNNEVDGLLRSGTIIESKSGRPRRPEHVLVQVARRAQGGHNVVLALNYKPQPKIMTKLRKLNKQLKGRLEVQYIPLKGTGYQVLVEGRNVEDPQNRTNFEAARRKLLTRKVKPQRQTSNRRQARQTQPSKSKPAPWRGKARSKARKANRRHSRRGW